MDKELVSHKKKYKNGYKVKDINKIHLMNH